MEDSEKTFQPFTRLYSSRSKLSGGYGLGLAIVAKIIHNHGGSIAVYDSPLGGSKFTINLPIIIG